MRKARALGIETVYQERALAEQQSLWRNIFMGRPLTRPGGLLDVGEMRRVTADLMREEMGFTSAILTPDTSVDRAVRRRAPRPRDRPRAATSKPT